MAQAPPHHDADAASVFDRRVVRAHRDRAARSFAAHAFLMQEVAARLAERLDDIKRDFPLALDLGCHDGLLAEHTVGRSGIERLVQCDLSAAMVARADAPLRLVADEEWLPIRPHSLDLVMSVLSLHWVNDLPGALLQIRRALKPDGLLLAAMLGGESLHELRAALLMAESEISGGASPRVSPFAEVQDVGALLQRAGFGLPVVDVDTITVTYADAFALMRDLRGMGESNANRERRSAFTGRATLFAAAQAYRDTFAQADGRLPATFQVLYLTAWSPHSSQQKPARRGSGQVSLARFLTEEPDEGDAG